MLAWLTLKCFGWPRACVVSELRTSVRSFHTYQHRTFTAHDSIRHSARNMATSIKMPRDPNTLSNYQNFVTVHTIVNFDIDFDTQCLSGNVVLQLKPVPESQSKEIILDTSHLDIKDVKLDNASPKWSLLPRSEPYGSALKIELAESLENLQVLEVDVSLHEDLSSMSKLNDVLDLDSCSNYQRMHRSPMAHPSADIQ